jgi:hypothetical protein
MMKLLERIILIVYRFYSKCRIYFIAWRSGYRVTNFEWLPNEDDRVVRFTPIDDFDHQRDDCPCNPAITAETDENYGEYTLIVHKGIFNDVQA